jgi:hypothetical protein
MQPILYVQLQGWRPGGRAHVAIMMMINPRISRPKREAAKLSRLNLQVGLLPDWSSMKVCGIASRPADSGVLHSSDIL